MGANNVAVVDRAQVPGSPYKPNLRSNLLKWLGIGLVAAASAIALFEACRSSGASTDQIPVKHQSKNSEGTWPRRVASQARSVSDHIPDQA
jgi:hypothetical protein